MTTYNGRIQGLDHNAQKMFYMSSQDDNRQTSPYQTEAIKGIIEANPLSSLFFSKQNIDSLQEAIRYLVWDKSCKKHIIDRQSDDELKVVMRSIYLQNAKHQPLNFKEQIRELNTLVLRFCVPKILNEIESYLNFRNEISTLPKPLERSENVSVKGTKTLELKNF
jgi:hypothetical protein